MTRTSSPCSPNLQRWHHLGVGLSSLSVHLHLFQPPPGPLHHRILPVSSHPSEAARPNAWDSCLKTSRMVSQILSVTFLFPAPLPTPYPRSMAFRSHLFTVECLSEPPFLRTIPGNHRFSGQLLIQIALHSVSLRSTGFLGEKDVLQPLSEDVLTADETLLAVTEVGAAHGPLAAVSQCV